MSAENDPLRPGECGAQFGQHPTMPHLVGICTRPEGHDGECDNVLPKGGAPR